MKKEHGFTLLEVLVAVIVLAIGLLGIAALNTSGVRTNHSAYLRSQATMSAYDVVDKMRSNRSRFATYLSILKNYETHFEDEITNPPDCRSSTCIEQDLINYDLAEWKNSLQSLPEGEGAITITLKDDIVIADVSIRWNDTRGEGDLVTFRTQTRL